LVSEEGVLKVNLARIIKTSPPALVFGKMYELDEVFFHKKPVSFGSAIP